MKNKNYWVLLLLLSVSQFLSAQKIWHVDTIAHSENFELKTDMFTAFTIQFSNTVTKFPSVQTDGKFSVIQLDEHIHNSALQQSVLYIQKDSIIRFKNAKNRSMHIIFQYVPALNSNSIKKATLRATCTAPQMVSPSTWRSGLTSPNALPSSTPMRHSIVHHSASGNGNMDYTSLVRNYYTQHTQVNGWDDIGYNFLVAFDGTVFIGRDRQTLNVPHYNVRGAHFCGKNEGTCGVCLIGDFTSINPSDTMLGSLKRLLSWMFFDEMRIATDSTPHPNPTDADLNHISGHLQGCATTCPGNFVYSELDSIRAQVELKRLSCQQWASVKEYALNAPIYSLHERELTVKNGLSYSIYNPTGQLVYKSSAATVRIHFLKPGFYLIHFSNETMARIYLE